MPEIDLPLLEAVRGIAGDGLHMLSSGYRRRPDGSLQYDGERPGARWHAHGYFAVGMWMLAVFLALWAWLSCGAGLRTYESVFPDLDLAMSRRTVQRWLRRALLQARKTQQAIRMAVIERSEPRPVERLFPQGLPPPRGLLRRHWKDPLMVGRLFRALVIAVAGSIALQLPLPILLAEARGRWDGPCDSLVI